MENGLGDEEKENKVFLTQAPKNKITTLLSKILTIGYTLG